MALETLELLADSTTYDLSGGKDVSIYIDVPALSGKVESVYISYTLSGSTHAGYDNEFELVLIPVSYDLCDYGEQNVRLSNSYWWNFKETKKLEFYARADYNSELTISNLKVTINYSPTAAYGKLNGKWGSLTPYVKVNGTWKPTAESYKLNDQWQN